MSDTRIFSAGLLFGILLAGLMLAALGVPSGPENGIFIILAGLIAGSNAALMFGGASK